MTESVFIEAGHDVNILGSKASNGKIGSNYESLTTQAEIHTGKGGFNIEAEQNTDLKGAAISSDAMSDKDKITTGNQ